ncbi:MAG: hypothetical protein ABIQ65_08135 [Thermoanaerobaculia bacterium]
MTRLDDIDLTVATVWNDSQIGRWARTGSVDRRVASIFGSRQTQLTGHGRAPGDVPAVDDTRIVAHAALARAEGLTFLYLLNGLCRHLDFTDMAIQRRLQEDLDWIAGDVQADGVVVADIRVARLIRQRYSAERLPIRISTIAAVRKPEDLGPWLPLDIDGVVLHHDAGRDFGLLRNLVEFLNNNAPSVQIELLVNEACVPHCFAREAHYIRLAREVLGYDEGFQQNCNVPRMLDPAILLSARWIRPEDLNRYTDLGIRRFKIAGREMSASWLDRAVAAYLSGRHIGNLVELLTMTPPGLDVTASDIVFISNDALDGFLDALSSWKGPEREFYERWATQLWNRGAFRVRDPGSEYDTSSGAPRCTRPGHYLERLISLGQQSDPVFAKRSFSHGRA